MTKKDHIITNIILPIGVGLFILLYAGMVWLSVDKEMRLRYQSGYTILPLDTIQYNDGTTTIIHVKVKNNPNE